MSYAALAAKYSLLGYDATTWYWLRFVLMCGIVGLVFAFLRRLRLPPSGSLLGAALFLGASSAWPSWTTISIGEPLGFALCLVALHCSIGYREGRLWVVRAVAVAALVLGFLLAKEMLVFLVPLVLATAACIDGEGGLHVPRLDRRLALMVAACAASGLVAGAVVLRALRSAHSASYSSRYDLTALQSPLANVDRLAAVLLPVEPQWPDELIPVLLINVAFVGALWLGIRSSARSGARRDLWLYCLALVTPVVGVVLYAPWPNFPRIYALPMLIGPAILVAVAVRALQAERRGVFRAGVLLLSCVVVATLVSARRRADAQAALLRVLDGIGRQAAMVGAADELLYLTRYPRPATVENRGAVLRDYVRAVYGIQLPPGREAPCADADAHASQHRRVLVAIVGDCDSLTSAGFTSRELYRSPTLTSGLRLDSALARGAYVTRRKPGPASLETRTADAGATSRTAVRR